MKYRFFLIVFVFCGLYANAQSEFLDYIVTEKNDTVYGTIRHEVNYVLYQRKDVGTHAIQYKQHSLKKVKALRYWGKVYHRKQKLDPIYDSAPLEADSLAVRFFFGDFISKAPALQDYVVTLAGDTVYGTIKDRVFDKIMVAGPGQKYTIGKEAVKGYRYRNRAFILMDEKVTGLYNGKKAFLEVLLDGKAKLYKYEVANNASINLNAAGAYYFIWKDNRLRLIKPFVATEMLSEIFADNQALQKKILDKEYTYESLYLVVKHYNESQ